MFLNIYFKWIDMAFIVVTPDSLSVVRSKSMRSLENHCSVDFFPLLRQGCYVPRKDNGDMFAECFQYAE